MTRGGVVFIAEEEDTVDTEDGWDHYFSGRFHGSLQTRTRIADEFEDLSLDDAITWARERADRIVVRIGYGPSYAIGFEDDELEPWPASGVDAPPRRRVDEETWKDRTDADPDATWEVGINLGPPSGDARDPAWDALVAKVAESLGATWSAEALDGWFADMHAARAAAARAGRHEYGWTSHHSRAYVVTTTVRAPTHERAQQLADALVLADLPAGWDAGAWVRFLGG